MVDKELLYHLKTGLNNDYILKDMFVKVNEVRTYQLKVSENVMEFAYIMFIYEGDSLTLKMRFSHFVNEDSPFKLELSYKVDRLFREFFN